MLRPGTTLSITDEDELVIKGNSVSLGYLKIKAKTDAAFKYDDGIRHYYTG